jgi:hypothetical protein
VDDIQAAATENDSGDDLADHDRHERSPAGRKSRAGQTGSHDQREVAEAHHASVRATRLDVDGAPSHQSRPIPLARPSRFRVRDGPSS